MQLATGVYAVSLPVQIILHAYAKATRQSFAPIRLAECELTVHKLADAAQQQRPAEGLHVVYKAIMVLFATRAVAAANRSASAVSLRGPVTLSPARCYANMTTRGIPLVLLGRTAEVGNTVTEALKPEYEGTL